LILRKASPSVLNTSENTTPTNDQLLRISEKIARLGKSKQDLEQQVKRLSAECESLYKINGELQLRIDELNEKRAELEMRQSLVGHVQDDARVHTKERISELVKEIDECITLLNT
jgi:peptidoglycan hydrolase CwlO-like protein